jgi:hypothetical protein
VDATIVGLLGKWFPTGAHKVGTAYACLVPREFQNNLLDMLLSLDMDD